MCLNAHNMCKMWLNVANVLWLNLQNVIVRHVTIRPRSDTGPSLLGKPTVANDGTSEAESRLDLTSSYQALLHCICPVCKFIGYIKTLLNL